MTSFYLKTKRLDLIPATLEILNSDLHDKKTLARLLNATIPPSWRPPLLSDDVLMEFIRMKSEKTDRFFMSWYWVLDFSGRGQRLLIGCGGITSSVAVKDAVVIGYSVLDEFQNRGYATEAVRHLIPVIFSVPGILRIIATTYPDLPASVRVLEKNGFVYSGDAGTGEGIEEGTVLFMLEKPDPSVALSPLFPGCQSGYGGV